MQIDAFWKHWQVSEDPFRAEEARDDPVFARLIGAESAHPDFHKVFGQPDQPAAAVVFGEKGSGKTAMRLMLEQRIAEHNTNHPERRAWVVRYDDLNPVLDRFAHAVRGNKAGDDEALLAKLRLSDHQDAILSRAVTRLIDSLTGTDTGHPLPDHPAKAVRKMDRSRRADLAVLAALYDQPASGGRAGRWQRIRRMTRLGFFNWMEVSKWLGLTLAVVAVALLIVGYIRGEAGMRENVLLGVSAAGAIALLGYWTFRWFGAWSLSRKIKREVHVVDRPASELRRTLADLGGRDLAAAPLPLPGDHDSRYQWTARLLGVLGQLGYRSLIVLVDRIDEPAMINGDAPKMRSVIWPMLHNKFLQQDGVGVKLLLPVELRHLLRREDEQFFQRARLDKQHMIDRLVWSGTTLYDLCSMRLTACRVEGTEPIGLTDIFEDAVTRQDLIDALDQMLQPRDAFKFMYQVIHDHCSSVPHDDPQFHVPRLTLMNVRKQQSQRVQDLQRGVAPA